jgi:hypothetical protein
MSREPQPLPDLLDCAGIMRETGLKRAGAEAIMRQIPVVAIPGLRKTYARRSDVLEAVDRWTLGKDEVQAA